MTIRAAATVVSGTVVSDTAVEPTLDHLVYATPDLARSVAEFRDATGVEPAAGGRHLGRGTRNYLVGLAHPDGAASNSYLEIIGPDPEHPPESGVVPPFGVADLREPRLVTWAVHPGDVTEAARATAAAGADLGPVLPMSRRTPDGRLLQWRLATSWPAPLDGIVPFLIDWGDTPHPASDPDLPSVILDSLVGTHPNPPAVQAVLGSLGVRLQLDAGPVGLTAVLRTPRGAVQLR